LAQKFRVRNFPIAVSRKLFFLRFFGFAVDLAVKIFDIGRHDNLTSTLVCVIFSLLPTILAALDRVWEDAGSNDGTAVSLLTGKGVGADGESQQGYGGGGASGADSRPHAAAQDGCGGGSGFPGHGS